VNGKPVVVRAGCFTMQEWADDGEMAVFVAHVPQRGKDDVHVEAHVKKRRAARMLQRLTHARLDATAVEIAHREDLRVEPAQLLALTVVDLQHLYVRQTVEVDDAWLGLAWHPDGKRLYLGIQRGGKAPDGQEHSGGNCFLAAYDLTKQAYVGTVYLAPEPTAPAFVSAFDAANHVLLLPIYRPSGREAAERNVTSEDLVEAMQHRGHKGQPPQADRGGASFRLDADTAAWGESVAGTFTLGNRGGAASDGFTVQLVLASVPRFVYAAPAPRAPSWTKSASALPSTVSPTACRACGRQWRGAPHPGGRGTRITTPR